MTLILRLLPIILALIYGVVRWQTSVRRQMRALDTQSTPLDPAALDDPSFAQAMAKLARATGQSRIAVHLHDAPDVNGMAAADGRIFLTRGFLRLYQSGQVSADELASVVAHELGHVASGHSRQRLIDFVGQSGLQAILTPVLGRVMPVGGAFLATHASRALSARLSRQAEFEADEYASALLIKAGIAPQAQITLLQKLAQMAPRAQDKDQIIPDLSWLASHPPIPDRIRAIEARVEKWGAT